MFDLRTNAITAITACSAGAQSVNDFKSTEYADSEIKGGKFPITTFVMGVGDLRIVERKSWSWGYNLVKAEIDILQYTRSIPSATSHERDVDLKLAQGLTKSQLSDANSTLTCELRESEAFKKIHDNIWRRTWTLEVLALESLT